MTNKHSVMQSVPEPLRGPGFADVCAQWLLFGSLEGWTERTQTDRKYWCDRLARFLDAGGLALDRTGIGLFLQALEKGSPSAGCKRPLKPVSRLHVYSLLQALCNWLVEEERLPESPMRRIPAPIVRDDKTEPFSDDELRRLLDAAKRTRNSTRDTALTLFLADTGVRAAELCALRVGDVDLESRQATIRCGKGNKSRIVAFGKGPAMALFRLLRADPNIQKTDPLFESEHGGSLTPNGLAQMMQRLGKAAGVADAHPHRWRHNCAVRLLRNGAHVFGVARQLGHARIAHTERYVRLAQADVAAMHRIASPIDNLNGNAR